MRTLRILALAFAAGVVLAACDLPTRVRCEVTGVDTVWTPSADGRDSLRVILTTKWCE